MRSLYGFLLTFCFTLSVVMAPAKQGGGQAGGATPTTGRGGTPPATGPTPGTGTQPGGNRGQLPGMDQPGQEQNPFEQRPIFLSGKVMLEDGTPPPESITIERVCN